MIGRILRGGTSLLVYACVATVIAQVILLTMAAMSWQPSRDRLVQILALAQGVDLFQLKADSDQQKEDVAKEQISHQQVLAARAVKVHHLELREEALRKGLRQLAVDQATLDENMRLYKAAKGGFDQQLAAMRDEAVVAGMAGLRTKLETLKPTQAKDMIVRMLEDEKIDKVVVLMSEMTESKASKIMAEFKTPEDASRLYEVLQRIGEGQPISKLAADTRDRLSRTQ